MSKPKRLKIWILDLKIGPNKLDIEFGLDVKSVLYLIRGRGVFPGGDGGAMATPDFGRSVNPISTRGGGHAHQIILALPDFHTFLRPWRPH